MADPTTGAAISLTALAVLLLGPTTGPYVLIIMAALCGTLWPLSAKDVENRKQGLHLVVRCLATSLALTGIIAGFLTRYGVSPSESLAPVSFLIASFGNGWRPVFQGLGNLLPKGLGKPGAKDEHNI